MDLKKVVESEASVPRANDTSYGVGYAPLTPLERLVYEVERGINSIRFKSRVPESGDDGNTGRGNRVNGLITPNRQMSLEATAGKNARAHVGKLYNVAARLIAERIYNEVKGLDEVYVRMLSQIGRPVDSPLLISIQYVAESGLDENTLAYEAAEIAKDEVRKLTKLQELILEQKIPLF